MRTVTYNRLPRHYILLTAALSSIVGSSNAQSVLLAPVSQVPGSSFGSAVAPCGDIDGDGYDDVLIGAKTHWVGTDSVGHATVISGIDGSVILAASGQSDGDCFGLSVSGAGDVNNDGSLDVVVGAPGESWPDFRGSASVLCGNTGQLLHKFNGETNLASLGFSVSDAGDADSDGYGDLIVGAYGHTELFTKVGKVYVFSGKSGSTITSFVGGTGEIGIGRVVRGNHDMDADGVPDYAFSGYDAFSDSGFIRLISGLNDSILATAFGAGSPFGRAFEISSDLSGDTLPDLIIHTSGDGTAGQHGQVSVHSGATGTLISYLDDPSPSTDFGRSLASLADIDGDGVPEILCGDPVNSLPGNGIGATHIYSGKLQTLLFSVHGEIGANFGLAASTAGDVDGDGLEDFVVGSPGFQGLGKATVYSGLCRLFDTYGNGCPGSGGFSPSLTTDAGCVGPDTSALIHVGGGLGGAPALLLIGLTDASLPIGNGCTLLIGGFVPASLWLPLGGSGPGDGTSTLSASIPPTPGGWSLYTQAFVVDPGSATGFSATNALRGYRP